MNGVYLYVHFSFFLQLLCTEFIAVSDYKNCQRSSQVLSRAYLYMYGSTVLPVHGIAVCMSGIL